MENKKNEKIKNYLTRVISEEEAEKAINETAWCFDYLKQPKKIADAILSVI